MIRLTTRIIALVILGVLIAVPGWAQEIHRSFDVKPGSRLELDLETGGDISIKGWDKNQVDITVTIEGRDKADVTVDINENYTGVEVSTEFNRRRARADVNMIIRVPRKFDLELSTTGGDVEIEDVDGKIEGSSMGGDIVLAGLAGHVEFTTMGGDIALSSSQVDGSLHTMGGDVDIKDVVGTVQGTTMGGDVTYDNVKSGNANSKDEVKISTMGGDVTVDEALFGADLHTMGGDIEVRKAGKYIKATTMGGEVVVHAIDGWIEANTMGGDMEVTMVGGTDGDRHVQLESMGGTVVLTVPAGLSMEFDMEINLSKNESDSDYTIISDFDVNVTTNASGSGRWKGSRTIKGTGSVNGGRNVIKIRTTNGDIKIQRAR